MNKQLSPVLVAAVVAPLLAVAVALPAGLDAALAPAAAGGLPLAWAAAMAIAFNAPPAGLAAALGAALPFSAYGLAAFAGRPLTAWFFALAGSSLAAIAWSFAGGRGPKRGRLRSAARIALGATPGIALAMIGQPLAGAAASALSAAVAALTLARSRR
jgi:hypothetical protein